MWDILERSLTLIAPDVEKRLSDKEDARKAIEVHRLIDQMRKKGTDREKLIIDLYGNISNVPPGYQIMGYSGVMSLKEFQRSRSTVEAMSDEVLRETVRWANEEFDQRISRKEENQPEDSQLFPSLPKE